MICFERILLPPKVCQSRHSRFSYGVRGALAHAAAEGVECKRKKHPRVFGKGGDRYIPGTTTFFVSTAAAPIILSSPVCAHKHLDVLLFRFLPPQTSLRAGGIATLFGLGAGRRMGGQGADRESR